MRYELVPNNSNTYLPGVVFTPSALQITGITNAYPMVVTTASIDGLQENTYQTGQLIKLFVPVSYGMIQANGLVGRIIEVVGDDISLDIDSRQFDAFVYPASGNPQPAAISPYGSRNLEFSNLTRQVPFQPFNNVGN